MCKDSEGTAALHSFSVYQAAEKLLILLDFMTVLPIQQDTIKGFILQQEVPAPEQGHILKLCQDASGFVSCLVSWVFSLKEYSLSTWECSSMNYCWCLGFHLIILTENNNTGEIWKQREFCTLQD